mgnify:CR=1 FL=1
MVESPFLPAWAPRAVQRAPYRGVVTATAFVDQGGSQAPASQLTDALAQGAVLYDWAWRRRLRAAGPDTRQWLNGMVTGNVRDLEVGQSVPAFLLNAKGRILGQVEVVALAPDEFVILTDATQSATLYQELERFIIMEEIEFEDRSAAWTTLAVRGAAARRALAALELPPLPTVAGNWVRCPATEWGELEVRCRALRGPVVARVQCETFEVSVAPEHAVALWKALAGGAVALPAAHQEQDRILSGLPLYGVDIRSTELPQETEQLQNLHFAKGCYLGQEIVERIRSRGNVHRRFGGFLFAGAVTAGEKLLRDGAEVGELTSVTPLGDGRWWALGYVKRELGGRAAPVATATSPGEFVPLANEAQ